MSDPNFTVELPNKMGRGYEHPETGETLIGVSTLIKWAVAKPFLVSWREGQVAIAGAAAVAETVANRETLRDLPWADANGEWSDDDLQSWLSEAPNRYSGAAAADGNIVHDWFDRWASDPDLPLPEASSRVRQMCIHLRDLVRFWQIEVSHSELTVFSRRYGIAGTLDLRMRSPLLDGGEWAVGDLKTTNGAKPRADTTFQLPAYASGDGCWLPDGTVLPMPPVSQDHGYVIKVKDTGASIHKIVYRLPKYGIDMFAEIEAAVSHYQWAEHGIKMVSDALQHPVLTPAEVERRIAAAVDRDELEATWRWAQIEGLWLKEHLDLIEERKLNLGIQ